MMDQQDTSQFSDLLAFLRQHRGNEANYRIIADQIDAALQNGAAGGHRDALQEIQEKYGTAYTTAREQGGSAWPEFERYVSELERCLINGKE